MSESVSGSHLFSVIHSFGRNLFTAASRTILLSFLAMVTLAPFVRAQETGEVKGTVKEASSGEPLAGAIIVVAGTHIGTVADINGGFKLKLQSGRYSIKASEVGYNPDQKTVDVQAGQTTTVDFVLTRNLIGTSEVVVVGTRTEPRTVINSPVPVDIIGPTQLKATGGLTETSQILEMATPSLNFPRPNIVDGTDFIRPFTLRGLSPDETLVLVNGVRWHASSLVNVNGSVGRSSQAVDLNAIPSNAIGSVEVLRDGASAQYGSDAIAGVVDVILKDDTRPSVSLEFGQTSKGDGTTKTLSMDDGFKIGNGGFIHLSGQYMYRGSTNRAGVDPRQQYFNGDPRNATYVPTVHMHLGDPMIQDGGLFYNSSVPMGGGKTTFYSFGGLTYRYGESPGFFRLPSSDQNVRAIYPNGFLPSITAKIWDGSFAAGLKGNLNDWMWNLAASYGRNSFRFGVIHSVNVSMGTSSPTSFYAGTTAYQQIPITLDVNKAFDIGLSAPLNLAMGIEYRLENYSITAGEPASYENGGVRILDGPDSGKIAPVGAQVFPGFTPGDQVNPWRNSIGVYADLGQNLTSQLFVDLAGRYEHYSDFGSTANGKLAAQYFIVKDFSIRGAASTGFRAPTLGQSYYSTTSTVFINGTPYEIRTFPVNSPAARALGAQPLKPEKSVNLSAGIATHPLENLSLTVDYFNIFIKDRILLSGNFTGQSIINFLQAAGIYGVTGGRFFTNAVDTRTYGVEAVLRYGIVISNNSTLQFTGSYASHTTKVTRVSQTPPQLAGLQSVLFGRDQQGLIEVAQPKDVLNLMADYSLARFNASVKVIRFGQYTNIGTTPSHDQTFSAKWITDLDLSYGIFDGVVISAGANNLFNVYPDQVIPANSYFGQLIYSGLTPWGFNGAFYYGRISYSL